ncbi:unnamed protein product [Gadus morhua 'NCC']
MKASLARGCLEQGWVPPRASPMTAVSTGVEPAPPFPLDLPVFPQSSGILPWLSVTDGAPERQMKAGSAEYSCRATRPGVQQRRQMRQSAPRMRGRSRAALGIPDTVVLLCVALAQCMMRWIAV